MLSRNTNYLGQKDWHIRSLEDRSRGYKDWVRSESLNGFFMDLDSIKFKTVDGQVIPCAIVEITRCDDISVTQHYLDAIIDRYFNKEKQGKAVRTISEALNIPAFIVLFQRELLWLWVYSFRHNSWKQFTKEQWANYLRNL